MPKIITPLTDSKIKAFKRDSNKKINTLSDGDGLYLEFKKTGKFWRFKYTINGKRKLTSFGKYPEINLKKAREIKTKWQEMIEQGIDPLEEEKKEKQKEIRNKEIQIHNVVYEWLEQTKQNISKTTLLKRKRRFETILFPTFCIYDENKKIIQSKPIDEISHEEILKSLLEKASKGHVETAIRLKNDLSRVFKFAIVKGYCKFNVVANIDTKDFFAKTQEKHYSKITDLKLLKELLLAINNYSGSIHTKRALQFVAMVPLRPKNLSTLKWKYIDFEKALLTIPRKEMKVKNPNLNDFILPLSKQALNLLREQYEWSGWSEYVFLGVNEKKHINQESPNKALRLMGFGFGERKQTLHSFRGTFRSLAETYQNEHNTSWEAKEAVLDHIEKNSAIRAYTHKADYTNEMRKLLQWWSNLLENLIK